MPTMSERDQFLQAWEREYQTTLKLLREYPNKKLDLKPSNKSRTAKELAWALVMEEDTMVGGAINGKIDFSNTPQPPSTLPEIISMYEKLHQQNTEKIRRMSDEDLNKRIDMMTGPKRTEQVRKADIFWTGLMDSIHHRGQFSVYLRMAGGRVPSIYGPTADEPWM